LRTRLQSRQTANSTESVIREMTRLAVKHNAVNLAQEFPDFEAPEPLQAAARESIAADVNQYAITWSAKPFRDAEFRHRDPRSQAFYMNTAASAANTKQRTGKCQQPRALPLSEQRHVRRSLL